MYRIPGRMVCVSHHKDFRLRYALEEKS
jgi:hypothetical protein